VSLVMIVAKVIRGQWFDGFLFLFILGCLIAGVLSNSRGDPDGRY
jgi:hypothetical protein